MYNINMKNKPLVSRNIELFYTNASEENRLNSGMGKFEFERIKKLIESYISEPKSTIIDVGGGTGKYAYWMAKKGHQVHLVDPVLKHIYLAEQRASTLKNKFSVTQGAAHQLDFPDNSADVVVLHGPLYHLQNLEERVVAIKEAIRVVKNKGIILGFAINHTASTLVGLLQGLVHKSSFFNMCKEELSTGVHNPPNDFPWLLAEGFYHSPEKLKEEFQLPSLQYLNTYAVEGMVWLDKNFFANLTHQKKRERLLQLMELTENERSILSFSPHLMIAVQKI